jgi:hypothetical protein
MRNATTHQMGLNLTDDFRLSGKTAEEFLGSFEDIMGEVRKDTYKRVNFVDVMIECDGEWYQVYWASDAPTEIFVKI